MTWINAYEILAQVRYDLNEHSTAYVQATDTTGAFKNAQIMAKINQAQRIVWNVLFAQFPEEFIESTSLTCTASVMTLPTDFYRFSRLENSDDIKIDKISINEKHTYSGGSEYQYYRYGNTLRIDQDGVSGTYTLWYYKRPRELTQGMSADGGALSLTLATTAKAVADYYNDMDIENITDDWVDTITDYTAARVCTITNTGAASKYYGMISDLPEAFHHLIQPKATILCKSLSNSPEKPSVIEIKDFNEMLIETLRGYAGTNFDDFPIEDVINDFNPMF